MISAYDAINVFYIVAIILFLYSSKKNSLNISMLEFLTAFLFGLIFETFNIQNGHYSYPNSYFYIGKVPISILITWYTIFMLGKYWTQSILYFYLLNKPKKENKYHFIPFISILTGLIASTLSFIIDPLATRLKWWEWYEPSPFLGVPIGEFYGIFIATCVMSLIFWILCYFFYYYFKKEDISISLNNFNTIDFLPFIIYELIILLFGYWSYMSYSSTQDFLNGAVVTIIPTQIIVIIWLFLLIDNLDALKIKYSFRLKLNVIIFLLILIGVIFFILTLLIIFSFNLPFLSKKISIHMILLAISICFLLTGCSLMLKKVHLTSK